MSLYLLSDHGNCIRPNCCVFLVEVVGDFQVLCLVTGIDGIDGMGSGGSVDVTTPPRTGARYSTTLWKYISPAKKS